MKNYLTTFLVSGLMLFSGMVTAQITIESSDLASVDDTVRLSTGLNVDFVDFTETGEGFVWDFSALEPVKQSVDTFLSHTDTPYWLFFLVTANMSKHLPYDIPIPGLPITNIYEYYKKTNGSFNYVGYGAMLNGIPLPLAYTSPDILYKFPMNYGNVDSSSSGLSFGIDNLGYMLIERYRKNTVDGYGTLITPYGTFDVLRLKSEVAEYDSIYLDSLNAGIPVNRNYTEYKWLAKGGKEPLLMISTSNLGITSVYVDSVRSNLIGIKEQEVKPVTLFPNPCKGGFNVRFATPPAGKVKVEVYSQNGGLIMSEYENVTGTEMKVNLGEKATAGNYVVVLSWDRFLITRKLTVVE